MAFERKPAYINLPKLQIPNYMRYVPTVQQDFIDVSYQGMHISEINLRYYLRNPERLIEDANHAHKTIGELNKGESIYQQYNRYDLLPRAYHISTGLWMPTEHMPWDHTKQGDDYLTVHSIAGLPLKMDTEAVRHYISLEKHRELMAKQALNIESVVATQVSKGVQKGVSTAVEKTAVTLRQIESQKEHIAKEMAKLERMEAKLKEQQTTKTSRRHKANRAGHVYLLQAVHDSSLFKIGRTNNPDNRLHTFSVKLPFAVEYVCVIATEDMYALESELHIKYRKQRMDGEWFKLSPDDVEHIKSLTA